MKDIDLSLFPDMVHRDNEPVFNEPWEAQAFAMVVNLHQNGAFSWAEWAQALSQEIHGNEHLAYYQHWLNALEKMVTAKALTSADSLRQRKHDWHEAAARTPHGDPIEL